MQLWSDRELKVGEWERQIERAMQDAVAAILLVSDNSLASDYIVQQELPYLPNAYKTRGLMILWAYLEPCDLKRCPEIRRFQAMTNGNLEPMWKMTDWWKETIVHTPKFVTHAGSDPEDICVCPAVRSWPRSLRKSSL